jgi:hypothetical protein
LPRSPFIVVVLTWGDSIRYWLDARGFEAVRIVVWFARELLWWRIVGVLIGALLCFAAVSPLFHELKMKFGDRGGATTITPSG